MTTSNNVHIRENEPEITESARAAMRAYVQRAEVRLSTLHRIGVAFINGAGLLVLFPVLFREEVNVVLRILIEQAHNQFPEMGAAGAVLSLILYLCVLYPFTLSLGIPLYALYLLVKDIVHFYFTIYTPGFPIDLHTPSFALSGITFSPDESAAVKREVLKYQYNNASSINFAIPFSPAKRAAYFDEIIEHTDRDILPQSRSHEELERLDAIPEGADDPRTIDRFNAAFGLARTIDRTLAEEVATSEISLVRHVLYLRRLVLRYIKTLLIFIWTTVIAFMMLPFLQEETIPRFVVLSLAYLVWSLFAMRIMRMPLGWIYRHMKGIPDAHHIDQQLVILEQQVHLFIRLSIVTSGVALVLSWIIYLR